MPLSVFVCTGGSKFIHGASKSLAITNARATKANNRNPIWISGAK